MVDMSLPNWQIEFYKNEKGELLAKEFILSIKNEKLQAKVLRDIELLQNHGNTINGLYSKFLRDGIFELRTKQSSNIVRVLYFFYVGKKIVLTNGFIKKTNKTPNKEIELAIKYKNNYLSSH